MQPIKMTLTALVIGTTLVGSAFAIDTTGKSDHVSGPDKAATSSGLQNTYPVVPQSNGSQATPPTTTDDSSAVTPHSGETATDKAELNNRGERNSQIKN